MPRNLRNSIITVSLLAGGTYTVYRWLFKEPADPSLWSIGEHTEHFKSNGDYHEKATKHTRKAVNQFMVWQQEKAEQAVEYAHEASESLPPSVEEAVDEFIDNASEAITEVIDIISKKVNAR